MMMMMMMRRRRRRRRRALIWTVHQKKKGFSDLHAGTSSNSPLTKLAKWQQQHA